MKSRIFCLIFILLFLVGCRSNVAIDDIASELEDKDSIIEQTRDEKERTSHKGLDSDIEFAEYKTTVKYETRVLEPKEKNRFHINDLGEAFTLDRIDVKVTGYHIFDDINDIPAVYSDYGPALLEKIRNRVDADKAIDPETGNFYQNKAWSGSDNQVLDIIKRNQIVAIEFTVIPDSQREVTLLFNSPIGPGTFNLSTKAFTEASLTALTVTSTASLTDDGKTAIAVTGVTLGTGEKFAYKITDDNAASVVYGQQVDNTWTQVNDFSSEISSTDGKKIAVVALTDTGAVYAYGSATVDVK